MKTESIHIRDPFVVAENGIYYLFGTTDGDLWNGSSFSHYKSRDLEEWEGSFPSFVPDESFWADKNFWAPEVHKYKDRYYMLASFKADGVCRGSQILVSNSLDEPFKPLTEKPFTPPDRECLDATLYIENGTPWAIFSHEWLQIHDGQFCRVRLSDDLTETIGEPEVILTASEAKWTKAISQTDGKDNYVTDGCFFHKTADGSLVMLWSSFSESGYTMGQAVSDSGIEGKFTDINEPLFTEDGGHGMIFRTFDGRLLLTVHKPNVSPLEHPVFFEIDDSGSKLKVVKTQTEELK